MAIGFSTISTLDLNYPGYSLHSTEKSLTWAIDQGLGRLSLIMMCFSSALQFNLIKIRSIPIEHAYK